MGSKLTRENFERGFLVDEELMAGVSEHPDVYGRYVAFVLKPETAEYLGYQDFPRLDDALDSINSIPRNWSYESSSGCQTGNCGKTGSCGKGCKGCALA